MRWKSKCLYAASWGRGKAGGGGGKIFDPKNRITVEETETPNTFM